MSRTQVSEAAWACARGRPPAAGFTLIELVVVMTIIAISYFAVRPVFTGAIRSAERRVVLRQLVGLLTQARTEAVGRGKLVRVVCEPAEGALWAEVQVDPTQDRSEFTVLRVEGRDGLTLPDDYLVTRLLIAGAEVSDLGRSEMYCYPDGSTDGLLLTMEGPTGQEVVIEVLAATGKVTLRV